MCYTCYKEIYGEPRIYNDKVEKAQKLIEDVYAWHLAGGSLHIVLDDFNLEDSHVEFSEQYAKENKDDRYPDQHKAEMDCIELFKQMTVDERASALALYEGFWERS